MINRYDFKAIGGDVRGLVSSISGEYVSYDDHAAEVARLEAEISELRKNSERYRFLKRYDLAFDYWGDGDWGSRIYLQPDTSNGEKGHDQFIDDLMDSLNDPS